MNPNASPATQQQSAPPQVSDAQQAWKNEQSFPAYKDLRTTQYGWDTDPNQDYNTNTLKIGNRDNPLTPHATALSDDIAKMLHANPGDALKIGGKPYYYADRAGVPGRVDLYQPQGMDKSIGDYQDVVNLGGGSPNLHGQALADTGEANVAKLLGQHAAPIQAVSAPLVPQPEAPMPNAQNNSQGIAFLQLLKGLKFGLPESPFANTYIPQK